MGASSSHHHRNSHHNHSTSYSSPTPQPPPPPSHLVEAPQPPVEPPLTHGYVSATATSHPNPSNPNPNQQYPPQHRPIYQRRVTIENNVNIKKETLKIEPDEQDPSKFLASFTLDATVPGSITIYFFAKEGIECNLTCMKEDLLKPVTITFNEGICQKFRQPSGTGIELSRFPESELLQGEEELEVYPLVVKVDASPPEEGKEGEKDFSIPGNENSHNSQLTQAVFEKRDDGGYQVRVVKVILWVNGSRYELLDFYEIGNRFESEIDGNDPWKMCFICLCKPRDTAVLPCRHKRICRECAKVVRFQPNRCPLCKMNEVAQFEPE
ncbi:RING/U-box superfamily protein [Rhynchospora pubera]|uniref:RING-type E3 ubiquitin transferase n=1 Tax=Rhynchospora pubera TaxID=906938 RepID=A0AAV8GP69_9POAL|nr:RING/U-box superfamily protein [Rhynchospora pubera]